jgi:hypothetical protein
MDVTVRDAAERSRFELDIGGQLVFADYRRRDGRLLITHVEAALPLRGTGAASRLMAGIVALAGESGEDIVPLCAYAKAWMRRHGRAAG